MSQPERDRDDEIKRTEIEAEIERKTRWLEDRGYRVRRDGTITQKAVAALMYVDDRTIRRYHELGGGPPSLRAGKHGRARYLLRDVVAWLLALAREADIAD